MYMLIVSIDNLYLDASFFLCKKSKKDAKISHINRAFTHCKVINL